MATVHDASTPDTLFHSVFCIVLLSIAFQSSLLAPVARFCNSLSDINLPPPDMLVIMIFRNGKNVLQGGDRVIQLHDSMVLTAPTYQEDVSLTIHEENVDENSSWIGKTIAAISPRKEELIVMILRDKKTIIPNGETIIEGNDILFINDKQTLS